MAGRAKDNILFGTGLSASNDQVVFDWAGGRGAFSVTSGTWGGGSVTLEMTMDGSAWFSAGIGGAVTADEINIGELPPCKVRVTIVTATTVRAQLDRTRGGSM